MLFKPSSDNTETFRVGGDATNTIGSSGGGGDIGGGGSGGGGGGALGEGDFGGAVAPDISTLHSDSCTSVAHCWPEFQPSTAD